MIAARCRILTNPSTVLPISAACHLLALRRAASDYSETWNMQNQFAVCTLSPSRTYVTPTICLYFDCICNSVPLMYSILILTLDHVQGQTKPESVQNKKENKLLLVTVQRCRRYDVFWGVAVEKCEYIQHPWPIKLPQ
ncbi:hypothetical protein B0H12DRAFT_348223 [Mycena haematopus]|nr:hypothetical protein B0H12DRAFT_348223 [Mycena haematopus]